MISSRLALSCGVGLLLAGAPSGSARAQSASGDGAPATITVSGDCPSSEAIWTDVRSIVSASDLARIADVKVDVWDLGSTYRVRIFGDGGERQRTFRDLDHVCDHRARFAAVFIVVTLLPPDALLATPPDLPPTPPTGIGAPPAVPIVPFTPASAAPPPKRFWIAASAVLDAAGGSGGSETTAAGGELRAYWGARRIAAMAGAGLQPRATFGFGGVGVEELRVPVDVGLAFVHAWKSLTLVGELSLASALVRIAGTNIASPQAGTRVDLGGRIGVGVRVGSPQAPIAPTVGLHALVFPKPYEATATPQGDLGQLPAVWIGLTAGLSLAP